MGLGKTLLRNGRRVLNRGRKRIGEQGDGKGCCCEGVACCCPHEAEVPVAYRMTFSGITPPTNWDRCVYTPILVGGGFTLGAYKPRFTAADLNQEFIVCKCLPECYCGYSLPLPMYISWFIGPFAGGISDCVDATEYERDYLRAELSFYAPFFQRFARFAVAPSSGSNNFFGFQGVTTGTPAPLCSATVTIDNEYETESPLVPWNGQVVTEPIYGTEATCPPFPTCAESAPPNCSECLLVTIKDSDGTTLGTARVRWTRPGADICSWQNDGTSGNYAADIIRTCGRWQLTANATNDGGDQYGDGWSVSFESPADGPCPPASGWLPTFLSRNPGYLAVNSLSAKFPWTATVEDTTCEDETHGPCPTDCTPCCTTLTFSFSDGSSGSITRIAGAGPCDYTAGTTGNATDLTCLDGTWTGTFAFAPGGVPELDSIIALGDTDGCAPVDPAEWDISGLPAGVTLTAIACS